MSAELYSVSGSGLTQDGVKATTLGGNKPLHRFLRGQPKIIGNVILVLGTSFFIITVAVITDFSSMHFWPTLPPNLLLGTQFIATGILYILTEHNPTKKTVTISFALSIISILGVAWTNIRIWPQIGHFYYYRRHEIDYYDNITETGSPDTSIDNMVVALESILAFHSLVGGVIFIVMSCLAGAALRSTKTQAIVVMTAAPTETSAVN